MNPNSCVGQSEPESTLERVILIIRQGRAEMNEEFSKYVGIDVSKDSLDVALGQAGEYWQADNAEMGIRRTVERLKALQPVLVVVESTGGLETALIGELSAAGVPFALVQPKR